MQCEKCGDREEKGKVGWCLESAEKWAHLELNLITKGPMVVDRDEKRR